MNISAESAVLFPISHSPIMEALFPDLACESKLLFRTKRKPTFDELKRRPKSELE